VTVNPVPIAPRRPVARPGTLPPFALPFSFLTPTVTLFIVIACAAIVVCPPNRLPIDRPATLVHRLQILRKNCPSSYCRAERYHIRFWLTGLHLLLVVFGRFAGPTTQAVRTKV